MEVSLPFPFGRLLFSLKRVMISPHGMAPGKVAQDPMTVAALTDWSDNECLIFETVNPPCEKARSTSVDVARFIYR